MVDFYGDKEYINSFPDFESKTSDKRRHDASARLSNTLNNVNEVIRNRSRVNKGTSTLLATEATRDDILTKYVRSVVERFNSVLNKYDFVSFGKLATDIVDSFIIEYLKFDILLSGCGDTVFSILPYLLCAFSVNKHSSSAINSNKGYSHKYHFFLYGQPHEDSNNTIHDYHKNLKRDLESSFLRLFSLENWQSKKFQGDKFELRTDIDFLRLTAHVLFVFSHCICAFAELCCEEPKRTPLLLPSFSLFECHVLSKLYLLIDEVYDKYFLVDSYDVNGLLIHNRRCIFGEIGEYVRRFFNIQSSSDLYNVCEDFLNNFCLEAYSSYKAYYIHWEDKWDWPKPRWI